MYGAYFSVKFDLSLYQSLDSFNVCFDKLGCSCIIIVFHMFIIKMLFESWDVFKMYILFFALTIVYFYVEVIVHL